MKRNFFFVSTLAIALWYVAGIGSVNAVTNISSVTEEHFAWNDLIGWIDFYTPNTAQVFSKELKGYGSFASATRFVSLDCATPPPGGNCSQSYQIKNNGVGKLSGWAWDDLYGWVSFCGGLSTVNCPGTIVYGVSLVPGANTSEFFGYAWNDIIGWISFNSVSGVPVYKVVTSWVPVYATGTIDSAIFDTGVLGGAQINSILWRGEQICDLSTSSCSIGVKFQIAASNCANGATNPPTCTTGTWQFIGPLGSGTASDAYPLVGPFDPGKSIPVNYVLHNNQRYFRYRATLFSDLGQTVSPRVDGVIVNWSP